MSKMKQLWEEYQKYQQQVVNKVAHSIGCEPSDLNDSLVMDCFINNLSTTLAANKVEHDLMKGVPVPF